MEKSTAPVLTEREKAIAEVRRRTKSRNPQFYTSDAIQGVDYVECPVSKARFRHIRADHITNVLGMTVDEFHRLYPGTKMVSDGRVTAIKSGLSAVTEDGLTVHQKAHQKAIKTLNTADSNGVRGYDRIGAKTRDAHLARVSEDGLNGYQRNVKHRLESVCENGKTVMQNSLQKRSDTLALTMKNGTGGASKASKIALSPIIELLECFGVRYYFDDYEYRVTDTDCNVVYSYDLTIPCLGVAIEYNSNAFHADPRMSNEDWVSWKPVRGVPRTASEVYEYDVNKARTLFKFRGFLTFFVWENTVSTDVDNVIIYIGDKLEKLESKNV